MAIPFSQSMRALHSDRGISSLVGLGIAVALLLLWAAWFFWAPITRYETGTLVGITRDGRVVAEFPAQALESIWQGQAAYIRPQAALVDSAQGASNSFQGPIKSIPAVVANILGPIANDRFRVSFSVQGDALSAAMLGNGLSGAFSGEVAVEVESVSPATLVARASGQFVDTPSISFSPQ